MGFNSLVNHLVTVMPNPLLGGHAAASFINVGWQDGSMQIPEGAAVDFLAKANDGYTFDHWDFVSGSYHGTYTTTTFSYYIMEETVATAFFKPLAPPPPQYSNVTITTTGEGTTDPSVGNYPSTYELGSTLYVTASPASGWRLVTMRRNGENWTSNNPGQFLNLQAMEAIEVVFAPEPSIPPPPPNIIPILIIGALGLAGLGYYLWKRKK